MLVYFLVVVVILVVASQLIECDIKHVPYHVIICSSVYGNRNHDKLRSEYTSSHQLFSPSKWVSNNFNFTIVRYMNLVLFIIVFLSVHLTAINLTFSACFLWIRNLPMLPWDLDLKFSSYLSHLKMFFHVHCDIR